MIAFVISDPRNDKNVMGNIPALPVTERDFFLQKREKSETFWFVLRLISEEG